MGLILGSSIFCQKAWPFNYDLNEKANIILNKAMEDATQKHKARLGVALVTETGSGKIIADSYLKNVEPLAPDDGMCCDSDYCINDVADMNFELKSLMYPLTVMIALEEGRLSSVDKLFESSPYCGLRDTHNFSDSLSVMKAFASSTNTVIARLATDNMNYGTDADRERAARQAVGIDVSSSPLEMLRLYDAIANGGRTDTTVLCSPSTASALRECLRESVSGQLGTAKYLRNAYVDIAAKTATDYAKIGDYYDRSTLCSWVAGYFPADNPRYTCIVYMQTPKEYASHSAMDVLKQFAIGISASDDNR